jgi:hypothetical protein
LIDPSPNSNFGGTLIRFAFVLLMLLSLTALTGCPGEAAAIARSSSKLGCQRIL